MSIESKMAYRHGFLKSEKWQTLRLICIAMDEGKCVVCGHFDIKNDAHHLFYRKKWGDTRITELLTLCRTCHESVHELGADVLCKKLWDRYAFIFRKPEGPTCQLCQQVNPQLVPILGHDDKSKYPKVCVECLAQFRIRRHGQSNPWKVFHTMKQEKEVPAVRQFHAANLRKILITGLEKKTEKTEFLHACSKAALKLRRFLSVDNKAATA